MNELKEYCDIINERSNVCMDEMNEWDELILLFNGSAHKHSTMNLLQQFIQGIVLIWTYIWINLFWVFPTKSFRFVPLYQHVMLYLSIVYAALKKKGKSPQLVFYVSYTFDVFCVLVIRLLSYYVICIHVNVSPLP